MKIFNLIPFKKYKNLNQYPKTNNIGIINIVYNLENGN